ncbi:MAG: aminoglycoside phosphotransferase family protein [Alistipes sp.]|nr:aminoglycoside phosphotransferase family protein [Alistipes sp.]
MAQRQDILDIAGRFRIDGTPGVAEPFGNGLINDSYLIRNTGPGVPDYVLQRINHHIFTDVDLLQSNILAVTGHIRRKLEERGEPDIERRVLRFIEAADGKPYHFDGENYWRLMVHIPRSVSYETIDPRYARYAGLAFGEFQQMLSDIDCELGETIPGFHDMEYRLRQLRQAVEQDRAGRLEGVRDIVEQLESRAWDMCLAERMHREGKLPKRVCHCDTKVNNILFDQGGGILCVIDLDTVMPSYIFSDYGDFLRTAANTGDEDDRDTGNVDFNMEIFEAFTSGYLESAGGFLTPVETEHLPYAAALFPYMQTVRFLWDYLNGDTYYKTGYPEHNLVRTRAQLKLLQSIERKTPQMRAYIEKSLAG